LSSIKIIKQNCDPSEANDRSLPYTCYLVHYICEGEKLYDLVITPKKIDIFDHYWDNYREGLKWFKQSEGRVNPKLWGNTKKDSKSKK